MSVVSVSLNDFIDNGSQVRRMKRGNSLACIVQTNHCSSRFKCSSKRRITPPTAPVFTLVPSHPMTISASVSILCLSKKALIPYLILLESPPVGVIIMSNVLRIWFLNNDDVFLGDGLSIIFSASLHLCQCTIFPTIKVQSTQCTVCHTHEQQLAMVIALWSKQRA